MGMRDKVLFILSALVASIVVSWVEDYRRIGVSPEAHLWHDVMVHSYRGAELLGRVGMRAESHYRQEVDAHAG